MKIKVTEFSPEDDFSDGSYWSDAGRSLIGVVVETTQPEWWSDHSDGYKEVYIFAPFTLWSNNKQISQKEGKRICLFKCKYDIVEEDADNA